MAAHIVFEDVTGVVSPISIDERICRALSVPVTDRWCEGWYVKEAFALALGTPVEELAELFPNRQTIQNIVREYEIYSYR